MMKRILLFLSLIVLCVCRVSFANISANDILELNNATPGTFKAELGTVIDAEQTRITTNLSTNTTQTTNITTATNTADTAFGRIDNITLKFLTTDDTSITNTSDLAYIRKYTATQNEGINLAAGDVLQIVTFALAFSDGGGDFAITPDTSSGFDQVNLTYAGSNVTLRYVDESIGWTLIGFGTSDTSQIVAPVNPFN